MKSTTQQDGNQLTISITAEDQDLTPTVKSVYNRLRETVDADGFRPGKAPNDVIERELGAEKVQSEVIDAAAEKLYRQAIEQYKIRPISRPHVAVKQFVPYTTLELEVTVEVMPEVELPDYQNLSKEPPATEVTEEEIEGVLESLRERMAERTPVDRAAASGDEVTIDFRGHQNDRDIPGAQAQDYSLVLGSNDFIPGFEEELHDLSAGEMKTFSITFPEDYGEASLAGETVEFEVTLKNVSEIQKRELDDNFAQEAGPFSSLEKLREDVGNHLRSEKEQNTQQQFQDEVLSELVSQTEVDIPQSMLDQEKERVQSDIEQKLSEQSMDLDTYLQQTGKTREEHDQDLEERARERVKTALILTEVAKAEELEVAEDELEVRLQALAGQYGDDQVQEEIQKPEVRKQISDQMLAEKTMQALVDYATAGGPGRAQGTDREGSKEAAEMDDTDTSSTSSSKSTNAKKSSSTAQSSASSSKQAGTKKGSGDSSRSKSASSRSHKQSQSNSASSNQAKTNHNQNEQN